MQHKPSPPGSKTPPWTPVNSGKPSGLRTLLGYYAIEWRDGYAKIELPLGPQHMNSLGFIHGGMAATLFDAAFGHAATWCSVPEHVRYCVTLSLTTTFLDTTDRGTVHATGRLIAVENRIATCQGEIVDEAGRLLALGQGSFRYSTGSERVEGVARRTETIIPTRTMERRP